MASFDLKVGILSENTASSNKMLWLFQDEYGYPSELITEDGMHSYPVVVIPDEKLNERPSIVSEYIHKKSSILIVCGTSPKKHVKTYEFSNSPLPVDLGDIEHRIGHCMVSDKENPLSSFFPQRNLRVEMRKDHNLDIMIRKVQVFPPAKTIVKFETTSGDRHPLLICGTTEEGGRFAIITTDDDTLICQHSNIGPLLHLAALEWCLTNKPFVRKWHWPNGKRMAVILTFDFETVATYPDEGKSWKSWWWHRSFDHFLLKLGLKPILKFLADKKVPSTWFVLGSQAVYTPKLVKKLASEELIEIGGHGDFHMGIDKSAKRFDEDDLPVQKERLEVMKQMIGSVVSEPIEGFRAPGLYANNDTLTALQESGLLWDCSGSPQTNYSTGWFFLPYFPIANWEDMRETEVVEIPVVGPWDQWCPVHGSPHSAQEYLNEMLEDFKFLYSVGGLQTLLIHPYWIVAHKAWWNAVESFVSKILQTSDVAVSSCGEVHSSWVSRKRMFLEAAYSTDTSAVQVQVKHAEPGLSLMVRVPEGFEVVDVLLNDADSVPFKLWKNLHSIVFVVGAKGDCKYTISLCRQ
jgi:hypothetical protein